MKSPAGQERTIDPDPPQSLGPELKRTAALGLPLAVGELGWMSTYLVDAAMIGRLPHSALSISASSLGNTIFYTLAFVAIGMLTGLETLVAQIVGRSAPDAKEACVRTLAQSLWFVLLGTPLVMVSSMASLPLLSRFGVSDEIVGETRRYLHALIWSAAPLLLYMALRRYLQSINRVLLVTVSLLSAVAINFVGDWAFLYGHLGLHPHGIAGSGWATCVMRVYMLALLIGGVWVSLRKDRVRLSLSFLRPDFSQLRLLTRIGWPVAFEYVTDLGFSTWMSIICARLGTTLLAAHQVVLDLDAFVYMVPQGIAYATVVRVGQTYGRSGGGAERMVAVRRAARASLLMAGVYIAIASALFAGLPRLWAGMYTNDVAVVSAAAPIFLICAILQFGDAFNVIFSYALGGLGDTRSPFLANTLVYWIVGAPISYWLAFNTSLSLRGLWIGRAVAALLTASILAVVWRVRLEQVEGGRKSSVLVQLQAMHIT